MAQQRNISIPTSEPPEALQNKGMSCSLPILSKARTRRQCQVPLDSREHTHADTHSPKHTPHPHAFPCCSTSPCCVLGGSSFPPFILENKGFYGRSWGLRERWFPGQMRAIGTDGDLEGTHWNPQEVGMTGSQGQVAQCAGGRTPRMLLPTALFLSRGSQGHRSKPPPHWTDRAHATAVLRMQQRLSVHSEGLTVPPLSSRHYAMNTTVLKTGKIPALGELPSWWGKWLIHVKQGVGSRMPRGVESGLQFEIGRSGKAFWRRGGLCLKKTELTIFLKYETCYNWKISVRL